MKEPIKHGDKMIQLKMRLWCTNMRGLKNAWAFGVVDIVTNKSRGIRRQEDSLVHFNDLAELPKAVAECLSRANISLIEEKTRKMLNTNEIIAEIKKQSRNVAQ